MKDLYRSRVAVAAAAVFAFGTACSDDSNTDDSITDDSVGITDDSVGITDDSIGITEPSIEITEPSIEITNITDGTSVGGNVVELALDVQGIEFGPATDDTDDGGTGQFHVFIDRDPVAPGEAIPPGDPAIIESAANPIVLEGLSVGQHRFVVVLGNEDDMRIGDAATEVSVQVEGPSVQLTGPPTANVGRVIQVEIAVEGVELVEAADDVSDKDGSAGHLHLFVNTEPTPAGEAIPTDNPAIVHTTSRSVAFPADLFESGTNTIWVVLGHGDHTPFEPRVLDRFEVEVS